MAKRKKEIVTLVEVNKMLGCVGARTFRGIQFRAIIAMLYRSGVRVAELLALEEGDLDAGRMCLTVRHGKGGKYRMVGVGEDAWPHLMRYMRMKDRRGLPHNPMFCTKRGTKLQASSVWRSIRRIATRAGIDYKRVYPHAFRHSLAFELSQEGTPIPVIQAQLGHSRVSTTQVYISHLNPEQVIHAVSRRPCNALEMHTKVSPTRLVADYTKRKQKAANYVGSRPETPIDPLVAMIEKQRKVREALP